MTLKAINPSTGWPAVMEGGSEVHKKYLNSQKIWAELSSADQANIGLPFSLAKYGALMSDLKMGDKDLECWTFISETKSETKSQSSWLQHFFKKVFG